MNRISSFIVALALVVVALNMTYSNFYKTKPVQEPSASVEEEKIVPVVGRVWTAFDGLGAGAMGFLVKDGEKLKLVPYQGYQGLVSDEKFQPRFMMAVELNGRTVYHPVTVDPF